MGICRTFLIPRTPSERLRKIRKSYFEAMLQIEPALVGLFFRTEENGLHGFGILISRILPGGSNFLVFLPVINFVAADLQSFVW